MRCNDRVHGVGLRERFTMASLNTAGADAGHSAFGGKNKQTGIEIEKESRIGGRVL
jgi:hypothetical protein